MSSFIRPVRWLRRPAVFAAALVTGAALAGAALAAVPAGAAAASQAQAPSSICPDANVAAFGPNVCVFNDTMKQTSIQADLNNITSEQLSNQFGSQRVAVFFAPGTYGSTTDPLTFNVGYYTSVAGLGLNPGDVVINGAINVFNQCFGTNCIALDNFWRSLSNLTINVATVGLSPCARRRRTSGRCHRPRRCGGFTSTACCP